MSHTSKKKWPKHLILALSSHNALRVAENSARVAKQKQQDFHMPRYHRGLF